MRCQLCACCSSSPVLFHKWACKQGVLTRPFLFNFHCMCWHADLRQRRPFFAQFMVERDLVLGIINWGEVLKIPEFQSLPIMTSILIPGGALQKLPSAEQSCTDPAKYLSLCRALWTSVFKVKHAFMCLLNWGVCLMQVFGGWAETLHGAKWNLCSIMGGSSWWGLEVE